MTDEQQELRGHHGLHDVIARTGRSDAEPLRGSETILVVEDEEAVRILACRILRKYGYGVIEAASGQEAIRLTKAGIGNVDLVLTDMMMPTVSGREVAAAARTAWPGVPVLVVSGNTAEETVDLTLDDGTHFLGKPYSPADLVSAVRRALSDKE